MATVTGLTATRMEAIEDASIVDGHIDGSGHLILTTFGGTDIDAGYMIASVPDGTDTVKGLVELATDAEAITGTDATRAVTPHALAAAVASMVPDATTTVKGRVELATTVEASTATDSVRAVTPAGLAAFLAAASINSLADVSTASPTTNDLLVWNGSSWVDKSTLDLIGATEDDDLITTRVVGDSDPRLIIDSEGVFQWSDGSSTADTVLYRSDIGELRTQNDFVVDETLWVFGDTNLSGTVNTDSGGDNRFDGNSLPRGIVAYAYSSSDSSAISTGTSLETGSINWKSGRVYRMTHGSNYQSSSSGNQATMHMRAGASSPTGDTIQNSLMAPGVTATGGQWYQRSVIFYCTSNQTGTAAVVIVSGSGTTTRKGASGSYILVEDLGDSSWVSAASGPST